MKAVVEFEIDDMASLDHALSEALKVGYFSSFRMLPDQVSDPNFAFGLRAPLAVFAAEMENKLRKNDHKTSWKDYPIQALRRLLGIEIEELDVALDFDIGDAVSECVDIANFAMMLADRIKARGTK